MSAAIPVSAALAASIKSKGWARVPTDAEGVEPGPIASTNVIDLAVMLGWSRRHRELDRVMVTASRELVEGKIGENEYEALFDAKLRRQNDIRANANLHHAKYGAPRQYSYNRTASKDRRRGLVRLGLVPDWLANSLTPGEESVAAVVLGDIQHHGHCDKENGKIATLAGCCERLVIRTKARLAESRHFQLTRRPRARQQHDTTIITAISPEMRLWLRDHRTTRRPLGERRVCVHQSIDFKEEMVADEGATYVQTASNDLRRGESDRREQVHDRPPGRKTAAKRPDCGPQWTEPSETHRSGAICRSERH